MPTDMQAQLQRLLARNAIEELIKTYARALDRLDEKLLRSVFHPGSRHAHYFDSLCPSPLQLRLRRPHHRVHVAPIVARRDDGE